MTQLSLPELFNLKGKVAIVTGGAVGIGRSTALRLAEAGAAVVVSDIKEDCAQDTVQRIIHAGGKAAAIRTDVSKIADAERAVAFALEKFGRVDILVNNAGIFPPTPVLETTEEQWDRVIDINLKGTFFMAKAAAKAMIEGGEGGHIVNVASIDALYPSGGLTAYDSSKGGVAMMTKSLAKEFAKYGILVNTLAPGGVGTEGVREMSSKQMGVAPEQVDLSKFPIDCLVGRLGEPDEMARVILFLATPLSSYLTGSLIVADGGLLIT